MTARSQSRGVDDRILLNLDTWCDVMIEPLLCGIVLGLIPVTLLGLFVAAAVGVGMLLGRHLAYKKSRSLLMALKEAIAIPTMPNGENAYAEKSA